MKKVIVFLFLLGSFTQLFSQENQDSVMNNMKNDFDSYSKKSIQDFNDFRDKANADFAEYMRKGWVNFVAAKGVESPIAPEPSKPELFPVDKNHQEVKLPLDTIKNNVEIVPPKISFTVPPVLIKPKLPTVPTAVSDLPIIDSVEFYGTYLSIPWDKNGMHIQILSANENELSSVWNAMSKAHYQSTLGNIKHNADILGLNDWGYYLLIKQISEKLYDDAHRNERIATQFFLLSQLGYRARVGSGDDSFVLLLPFKEPVYNKSYLILNEIKYYIFNYSNKGTKSSYSTFNQDFSLADKTASLIITHPLQLGIQTDSICLSKWDNVIGNVAFTLNYPQFGLEYFHECAVDKTLSETIIRSVKERINGMDEFHAVSYILNLIQNGFEYKTDQEMFGRQKPLFIEESFFYGTNNCKDRVLVFSWLMKNVMRLPTVMFIYDGLNGKAGHVACGVSFNSDVNGDYYNYGDRKFVMCDPTYINAPIGQTMPKYKDTKAKIVDLSEIKSMSFR